MIEQTLSLIVRKLDDYLHELRQSPAGTVIKARVINADGSIPPENENRILATVVNITHDTAISTYAPSNPSAGGGYTIVAPPLYIELLLMFSASFTDYSEALTYISQP